MKVLVADGVSKKGIDILAEDFEVVVKDKLPALLKSEAQTRIAAEYIESLRQKATIKLDGALAAAVESSKKAAEATAPAGEAPVTAPAAPAAP